jgi:hypothetical protein
MNVYSFKVGMFYLHANQFFVATLSLIKIANCSIKNTVRRFKK